MKSFASARKLSGWIVCSLCGVMERIFTRISADFSTVWSSPNVRSKSSPEQNIPWCAQITTSYFFHKFRCFYGNFSSARNHPADNSDTVRKYDRTLGCGFPEFSGKHFVIQREHKCQCNRICGMCMVNNTMLSISKFFSFTS